MSGFLAFLIVAICWLTPPSVNDWGLILVFPLITAGYFFIRGSNFNRFASLLGLIAGLLATTWEQNVIHQLEQVPIPPDKTAISGVIADRDDRPDSIVLLLDETTIHNTPSPGQIRLVFKKAIISAQPGDQVTVQASFYSRQKHVSPGSFDISRFFYLQGIALQGKGLDESVSPLNHTGNWRWNRLRWQIAQQVGKVVTEQRRGLTEVMLVGKRNWLERELREKLQAAGIYHLISISGLHMTIVAGGSFFLFRLLMVCVIPLSRRRDMKPWAATLAIFPMVAYALLSGWSIATQRSVIMALVFLFSVILGRPVNSWRSWTLAAILLLLWHPSQLYDVGFQLSFMAVATLLAVSHELHRRKITSTLWQTLIQTVAVGTILSPLVAYDFHMASWYGFFANLATITWSSFTTVPLGFFALMVWPVWPEAFDPLVTAMSLSLDPLRWVADWNYALPGGWWRTPGPPLLSLVITLSLLPLTASLPPGNKRLLAIALLLLIPFWPRQTPFPDKMLFVTLDVKQAQSVLLRDKGGGWHVVDAGGVVTNRYHVGEGIISPFLWWANASHLEHIILSHPQRDHMAAVSRLLENFPTKELWIGPFAHEEESLPAYQRLLATARRQNTRIVHVAAGKEHVANDLTIKIIHPDGEYDSRNVNNKSLAVMASHGKHHFLLPADLEIPGINRLMKMAKNLSATVMVVPHHGSANSRVPDFPRRVNPSHVIFSVGENNQFGFPKKEVVQDWLQTGARLWRTDQEGTLLFVSDGESLIPTPLP